jgi:hypothetical protein
MRYGLDLTVPLHKPVLVESIRKIVADLDLVGPAWASAAR